MTHLLRVWSRHLPKETLQVVNVSPASLFLRWMDVDVDMEAVEWEVLEMK